MNESDSIRNRGDAPRPLSQLRARLQDDACRGLGAGLGERLRMESQSAMEWEIASGGGKVCSADSFDFSCEFASGNEHRIFQNFDGSRAIKVTRPPNYGARGSLLDYLDNLVLNNFLSGDDLKIEGVLETEKGPQLIVSQPWIKGNPASSELIGSFFMSKGFEPYGENAWFSEATGIRIMDARSANIIIDEATGLLMPIDIHIHAPGQILEKAWVEQQRRENRTLPQTNA